MTIEERITQLEERITRLERQLMTPDERKQKEDALRAITEQMTSELYDRNPQAWRRLSAHASRLEQELGL